MKPAVNQVSAAEVAVKYRVADRDGASVEVEGENWVIAFGAALARFGVHDADHPKLTAVRRMDGTIVVDSEMAEAFTISPAQPDIKVQPSGRSKLEEFELPPMEIPTGELGVGDALAKLRMPESTLAIEAPETLAERVFDLSMDLASAPEEDAYSMALELLLEFVEAEAGSVARGTLNDPNLKFVAATGPVADEIRGREVGFGEGLVGMCFDLRSTIVVDEVDQDTRHLDQFDSETGFRTVAALCVPIFDEAEGLIYGVIQLLNPPGRGFTMHDKEAAELIAQTLSTALTRRS